MLQAERLRALREAAQPKLTQAKVAADIEVERTTYVSWETGKRGFGDGYAVRLEDYFGAPRGYLHKQRLEARIMAERVARLEQ